MKRGHVAYLDANAQTLKEIEETDLANPRAKAIAVVTSFDIAAGYAQICSRESIARLVTKALDKGEVTAAPGDARRTDEKRIAIEFVRQATGRPVTEDQASLVYWIVVARQRTLSESESTAVTAFLGPDLLATALNGDALANVLSVDLVARNLASNGGEIWNRLTSAQAAATDPGGASPAPAPSFTSASPARSDPDGFADRVFGAGSPSRLAAPAPAPVAVAVPVAAPQGRSTVGIVRPTLLDVR